MRSRQNQSKICASCGYPYNPENFTVCESCGTSVEQYNEPKSSLTKEPVKIPTTQPKAKISSQKNNLKKPRTNWQKEILKPQNASGVAVAVISLFLLTNQLLFSGNNATAKVDKPQQIESVSTTGIKLVKAIKDVENVPGGIFSYSGDGYFAALLKAGLVAEIVNDFPNFATGYRSPSYEDSSYSVAIDMLLAGEIDFVFNARPLTPTEYAKAKLQNIQLQETPIAVDGIVFYTHPELTVSKITIKELMGIFGGRITNWKQLGGEDLAITPVMLSKENVESLGFEVGDRGNIQYASNHTLAVREVIDTPGAIGYASASLVQNQSLLKFLTLGQSSVVNPNVVNYVSPFLSDGQTNKQAFSRGTYPLVRRLTLVNSNRPNSEAAGTAIANIILSGQGQAIVDDAGFVSLRNQNK